MTPLSIRPLQSRLDWRSTNGARTTTRSSGRSVRSLWSGPMEPIHSRSIPGCMTTMAMGCQETIISGTWVPWITRTEEISRLSAGQLRTITAPLRNYAPSRSVRSVKEAGQRDQINCSIRAFIRLEVVHRLDKITLSNAQWDIARSAIADHLAHPEYAARHTSPVGS